MFESKVHLNDTMLDYLKTNVPSFWDEGNFFCSNLDKKH